MLFIDQIIVTLLARYDEYFQIFRTSNREQRQLAYYSEKFVKKEISK